MAKSIEDSFMDSETRIEKVAELAELALWDFVASEYPEIETGMLDPILASNFAKACEDIIRAWVYENSEDK